MLYCPLLCRLPASLFGAATQYRLVSSLSTIDSTHTEGRAMIPRKTSSGIRNPILISNASNGNVICTQGLKADNFQARLFGLLGRKSLAHDEGLLIAPSSGVHTFGMSFPIDIVALDKNNCVIGAFDNIGPRAIRGLNLKTRSVLELPAGKIQECEIQLGHQLTIRTA